MSVGGGTSGIIGRAMGAAAPVLAASALQAQRAEIEAKRDEVLNRYRGAERSEEFAFRKGQTADEQAFRTGEREAGQEFQAGEAGKTREAQAKRDTSLDSYRQAQLELTRSGQKSDQDYRAKAQGLAERQLTISEAGADLSQKLAKINLSRAEDQQTALKLINDPNLDAPTREAAMDYLNYSGMHKGSVVVKQIQDRMGNYQDDFAIFVDGKRQDEAAVPKGGAKAPSAGAGSKAQPAAPKDQAEFDALPKGAYYRDPGDPDPNHMYQK